MEGWDVPALYLSDGQLLPDLKLSPISWLEDESLTQRGSMTCAMRHSLSLLAPELGAALFPSPFLAQLQESQARVGAAGF